MLPLVSAKAWDRAGSRDPSGTRTIRDRLAAEGWTRPDRLVSAICGAKSGAIADRASAIRGLPRVCQCACVPVQHGLLGDDRGGYGSKLNQDFKSAVTIASYREEGSTPLHSRQLRIPI